jgi:uncharacterized membrane protein
MMTGVSGDVQVFVATYADETSAQGALETLRRMDRDGVIELVDAAAVVKRPDGKVAITETADPSTKKWALRGAVAGGVLGLVFPPSLLVSAAVGAGGGGLWGKLRDKGFDDSELRRVGESLPPGGSAIVAIAEDKVVQRLRHDLEAYEQLNTFALTAEQAAVITAHVEPDT